MKSSLKFVVIFGVAAVLFGVIGGLAAQTLFPKTQNQLMAEFYDTETAISISPSDYLRHLQYGLVDGTMVDLRSAAEYQQGHLVTSINIPVGQIGRQEILTAFAKLPKDKPIITYCYSSYCMLSKNIGKYLADNGIFVKHLTAGWLEINRDYSDFVVKGYQAGDLGKDQLKSGNLCPPGTSGFEC